MCAAFHVEQSGACDQGEAISTIPEIISTRPDKDSLVANLSNIKKSDTQTLILRIETTSDPLVLWCIHTELNQRGVPPCLRWPANDSTPQADYITWLADMLWVKTHLSSKRGEYGNWQRFLRIDHTRERAKWHREAHALYLEAMGRGIANWCANGIGLTDTERADLMTLPTKPISGLRRTIKGDAYTALRNRHKARARAFPDRSGQKDAEEIANRRARMWRVYILSGKNQSLAARRWVQLTGEDITRQAVSKQLALIAPDARQSRKP
jgi:hypothetical protein